ncbi:hypothetical protein [Kitasatospora kifunensis]|uniref:Lipoprotein n=1 Tax=Kitasatospora kifunensis TaxID=58351 RepID=A0A7W7VY69_KITKI|nr:hypothetical protein [Kitasatospora kifunensis]MBB4926369.1 hypothetical protein [Kitasatospora kifunensis]
MRKLTAARLLTAAALAVGGFAAAAPAQAAPAQAAPAHVQPADSQTVSAYVTSYGYNDDGNGHYGTAQIAYPQIHQQATEGSGAYNDPSTFATDQNEFAPGTIIYVPHLQKYFIMEDGCTECSQDWQNGKYHVDLWMGPASSQPEPALDDCEASITRDSAEIIANPDSGLPVDTTPMFSNGQCTAVTH